MELGLFRWHFLRAKNLWNYSFICDFEIYAFYVLMLGQKLEMDCRGGPSSTFFGGHRGRFTTVGAFLTHYPNQKKKMKIKYTIRW